MSDMLLSTKTSPILEVLGGIYHYLPNTFTTSLLVLGVFLGKISWVLIAAGAIVLTILVSVAQYGIGYGAIPGAAAVAACSIIPSNADSFKTIPSLWMATALFYMTFIITNATNIYSTRPTSITSSALTVQHRKGVGVVSIVTTVILLAFMIIPRFATSTCESTFGAILGGLIGIGAGYAWWRLLDLCGADVYPDIHGVMIGLRPGQPYS